MRDALKPLSGKRVLITGHTGFVGSWLTLWLHTLGAKCYGYALPPHTRPSNYVLTGAPAMLEAETLGDICDYPQLEALYKAARPDVVIHLAAQAIVSTGYREPRRTFETNVIGTAALLDCVRAAGHPCTVVVMTSDKCYHNPETLTGIEEDHPMGGKDPYSASKGAAELAVAAYRHSFFPPDEIGRHGVQLASVRAGNIIGGGDFSLDRIVPDIVRAISEDRKVILRRPQSIRPWQHVCEPIYGMLSLAARMIDDPRPLWSEGWNFGPAAADRVSVAQLTEMFIGAWGTGGWEHGADAAMPEANYLVLNSEKSARHLGWRCRMSASEAIQYTAEWYRRTRWNDRWQGKVGALEACRSDVERYLSQ